MNGCQSPELWWIMAVSHQNYEGSWLMRTALNKHQCCVTTFYVTPPKFNLVYEWLSVTRTMMDHGCQSPELWRIMAHAHSTQQTPVLCYDLLCNTPKIQLSLWMAVSHQNYEGSWLSVTRTMEGSWLSVTRTMRDHGCQSPELWGIMAVSHQNYEGSWLSVTRTMMDHGCQSPELWGIMAVSQQNYGGSWLSITKRPEYHK